MQGPGVFNGKRYFLYYADAATEIAFIVPSLTQTTQLKVERKEGSAKSNDRAQLTLDLSNNATPPSQQVNWNS